MNPRRETITFKFLEDGDATKLLPGDQIHIRLSHQRMRMKRGGVMLGEISFPRYGAIELDSEQVANTLMRIIGMMTGMCVELTQEAVTWERNPDKPNDLVYTFSERD